MEVWMPLALAPDLYEVSNMGRFRSKARIDAKGSARQPRELILGTAKDGYKRVNLFLNKKAKHITAHRLVYETFCGPIPIGHEINHKNGVRDDNRPENLEALTHAENVRYSKEVLGADYATYGNGRMTPEQRDKIFELRSKGMTSRAIAKEVGFCKSQVMNVLNQLSWDISPQETRHPAR